MACSQTSPPEPTAAKAQPIVTEPAEVAPSPTSADLFTTYHDTIRRYIQSMVHDPDVAEDLTQDVFLHVHRSLASVRDPHAVVSWLYRIATRACYDQFRTWARHPRPESLDAPGCEDLQPCSADSTDTTLDGVIERAEMTACVRGYLDSLSDDYRNVILLHDVEALTTPEIARMLGVTVGAVKIRLHRARRKLQAALTSNCAFADDEHGVLVCESITAAQPGRDRADAAGRVSLGTVPSS